MGQNATTDHADHSGRFSGLRSRDDPQLYHKENGRLGKDPAGAVDKNVAVIATQIHE